MARIKDPRTGEIREISESERRERMAGRQARRREPSEEEFGRQIASVADRQNRRDKMAEVEARHGRVRPQGNTMERIPERAREMAEERMGGRGTIGPGGPRLRVETPAPLAPGAEAAPAPVQPAPAAMPVRRPTPQPMRAIGGYGMQSSFGQDLARMLRGG